MEEIRKISVIKKYNSARELDEADRMLLEKAKEATGSAYAPYSKFYVGCALRMENGIIVTGSNQENAAYPSGLCAERVAIFHAGAAYPAVAPIAMAVTARTDAHRIDKPVTSCGACLQSMSEYETRFGKPLRLILQGESGEVWVAEGLRTFMPFMFGAAELGK
jgi:cytidine deaminase